MLKFIPNTSWRFVALVRVFFFNIWVIIVHFRSSIGKVFLRCLFGVSLMISSFCILRLLQFVFLCLLFSIFWRSHVSSSSYDLSLFIGFLLFLLPSVRLYFLFTKGVKSFCSSSLGDFSYTRLPKLG